MLRSLASCDHELCELSPRKISHSLIYLLKAPNPTFPPSLAYLDHFDPRLGSQLSQIGSELLGSYTRIHPAKLKPLHHITPDYGWIFVGISGVVGGFD